jgi:hypothetical protein
MYFRGAKVIGAITKIAGGSLSRSEMPDAAELEFSQFAIDLFGRKKA